MPYNGDMLFIETPIFSKLVYDYLSDDEYAALQWTLVFHPKSGDVIPKSGGIRKLRWSAKGKGKRGDVRVIYYVKTAADEIWLLTLYAKNELDTIPAHILKAIRQEIEDET